MSSGGGGSNITSDLTDLILVANAGNSSFVVTTDNAPSIFVDSDAKVGINTLTPASRLEVNSEDGTCITLRNNGSSSAYGTMNVASNGNLEINTNGSKLSTNKSFDVVGHNGSSVGLKLAGATVQATAAELNYLAGAVAGSVASNKAIVVDDSKALSGLNSVSATQLTGTLQTAAQPNITSVGTLSSLSVTNGVSASQLTGTLQTAAQPNITSVGTLSSLNVSGGVSASQLTGTLQTAAQPNITSVGDLSSLSVNGVEVGTDLGYVSGVIAGTATESKVVVLDENSSVSGIGSLSADELTGTLQTAAQPNITSVGTLSSLNVTNGVSASQLTGTLQTAAQPNITSVGNLSSITVAGNTVSSELGYLKNIELGTAAANKAIVVGSTKSVSGLNSVSATQLTGTLQTAAQPNITSVGDLSSISIAGHSISSEVAYLDGVVAGTASNEKVMVLNGSGSISGVNSLNANSLSGTIQTTAQPNITSVGTLSSLNVSGSTNITSTTDSTSVSTGALKVAGGLAVAKNIYSGGIIDAQGFKVNGVDISSGGGSVPTYCLGVTPGTASNGKVVALDDSGSVSGILSLSANSITGQLQTADQPNVSSVGTLSSLGVDGSVVFNNTTDASNATTAGVKTAGGLAVAKKLYVGTGIYGSINTSNQSNITTVGTLSNLTVGGQTALNNTTDSTASTNGALTVNGGVGIAKNLYVGLGIHGTLQTGEQPQITSVGTLSSLNVSGAVSASQLTGTLQTAAQPNITSTGTLTSLDVSGSVGMTSTTDASGPTSGSVQIAGGVGIAKKLHVGTGIYGTLYTGAQPNITSVGTLSSLSVTNDVSADTLTGTIQTAAQPNITSVGTLSSLSVTNGVSASTLSGTLSTAAQPNITSVGTLSSLSVTNGVTATTLAGTLSTAAQPNITSVGTLSSLNVSGNIAGTLSTAAQPNITSVGTLSSLSVSGGVSAGTLTGTVSTAAQPNITSVGPLNGLEVSNTIDSSSSISGAVKVAGGVGIAKKLYVGTGIYGTVSTAQQPNITSVGTLTGLAVSGDMTSSSTTDSTSPITGAIQVAGGVGIAKNLNVGGTISGSLSSTTQQGITSVGTLSTLNVSGNVTVGSSTFSEAELAVLDGVVAGTAANSKALVLSSTGTISGIGSLSATTLTGTLSTATQPNITSVGTLSTLTVSGSLTLSSITDSTSSANGAVQIAGGVGIAKNLNVGGTISGTLATAAQPNITSIGTLSSLTVSGNLTVGSSTFSEDELLVLDGVVAGTASNGKALVLSSSGAISGISSLSATTLTGSLSTGAQTGITSVGTLSALTVSGTLTLSSITDSTSSTTGAVQIAGGVGIAKNLNVGGTISGSLSSTTQQGITSVGTLSSLTVSGNVTVGSSTFSEAELAVLDGVVAGTASNGKALVLSSTGTISGISSLSATTLTGSLSTGAQTGITSVGTLSALTVSGTLTLSSITDSTSSTTGAVQIAGGVGIAKNLNVGGTISGTLASGAQTGITSVGTLSSLTVSGNVTVGSSTFSEAELAVLDGVVAGTAANSKALVLNSSGAISGIGSLSATTLTGTLSTAAQTGITSVGTLSALTVSGTLTLSSVTDSTSSTTGAVQIAGGVGIVKNLNVGGTISGTLATAAQPNITSVGTLSSLTVTNGVSAAQLTGTLQTAAQPNITSVGTLSSLTVTNGVSAAQLTGTLQTAAQPNITSVGTLSSLTVTNGVSAAQLTGTLQTAAQPNITSHGTLTALSVSGGVTLSSVTDSTSSTTGAVQIAGGVGIVKNLNVGGSISGTLATAAQPNITSVGTLSSLTVTNGVSAAQLTGTLQTAAQPNITSHGTLTALSVSGGVTLSSVTDSTSSITGAVQIAGGVGIVKNLNVGGTISGTLATAAQPSITSVGTLSSLAVSGAGSFGSLTVNGVAVGGAPDYVLSITPGTASASKALVLDSSSNITGINSISSNMIALSGGLSYTSVGSSSRALHISSATYTNAFTAASGTDSVSHRLFAHIGQPTLTATNTSVTTTTASTFYIAGAPQSGTNMTITNPYALYVNSGESHFNGDVSISSSTATTSATTGALVVTGGLATGAGSWIGGSLRVASTTATSSSTTGALVVSGGIGVAGDICLKSGSSIGIGMVPTYTLDVTGTSNWTTTNGTPNTYRYNGGNGSDGNYNNQTVTICARFNGGVAVTNAAIYVSSDRRLKKDIDVLSSDFCKQFIQTTIPVSFKYKKDNTLSYGYIAQDLIKLGYGDLTVSTPDENMEEYEDEDGFVSCAGSYFNVSYQTIIPILAKGLKTAYEENQTLSAKVDNINDEMNQLKDTNQQLLNMIAQLSARLDQLEQK
jgi:Chaperone of endosialidase